MQMVMNLLVSYQPLVLTTLTEINNHTADEDEEDTFSQFNGKINKTKHNTEVALNYGYRFVLTASLMMKTMVVMHH